jgi:hypothetical protein
MENHPTMAHNRIRAITKKGIDFYPNCGQTQKNRPSDGFLLFADSAPVANGGYLTSR